MQRLTVYCGSRHGHDSMYVTAARSLGEAMAARGIGLVYGAAQIGLMGVLADAVLAGGGEVIGVIPEALMQEEVVHRGLTRLEVVETMHLRKARMLELGDAMVALPGGLGTLEELFEALTWLQLRFHHKPCGLLNVGGYFDSLLNFLDGSQVSGFLAPEHRSMIRVHGEARPLLFDLMPQS